MSLIFVYKRALDHLVLCSALLLLQQIIKSSSQAFSTAQYSSLLNQKPTPARMHYFSIILATVMAGSAFVSAAPAPAPGQDNTLDAQAAACDVYKYSACGVSLSCYHSFNAWRFRVQTDGCGEIDL